MINGGATKPKSYCKLSLYIQYNAELFYDAIQNLCMFGALNCRRGKGLTLLLPNMETQKKIDKCVGSDPHAAINMINAHIIPTYLPDIKSFESGDVINKLGHRLNIMTVTSSTATIGLDGKKTATIKREPKFKRLHDTSNIAVYLVDGAIPTTGEEATGVAEVTGGDDNWKELHKVTEIPSDCNLTFMVEDVFSIAIRGVERKHPGIDILTHKTMSLLFWMNEQEKYKPLYKLVTAVKTKSPLAYPFILSLIPEVDRQEWQNFSGKYNKAETLKAQENGKGLTHETVDSHKAKTIKTLTGPNICSQLQGFALDLVGQLLKVYPEYASTIKTHFETNKKFSQWVLLMSEFSYLYTIPYIKAVNGGHRAAKDIQSICDVLCTHICTPLQSKNYVGGLMLADPTLANADLYAKEKFCTLLSMYANHAFFTCPGDLDTLAAQINGKAGVKTGGPTKGTTFGYDTRPNIISPTSFENYVAKWWLGRLAVKI